MTAHRGEAVGRAWVAVAGTAAVVAIATPGLTAQDLGQRAHAVRGEAAFRIPLGDGVEVCENGIRRGGEGERYHWGRWRDGRSGACSTGTAEVVLHVRDGRIERLELDPWSGRTRPGVEDLGEPGAPDAAAFFAGLARGGDAAASGRAAEHALMASVLLDGVEVWPDLLAVARDRALDGKVRRSALFWVSQVAAGTVTAGLREIAEDGSEEQDVRDAAVFALSQRPAAESVPALMDVVRTAPHAETRRKALFWLAQADDPRVADFFEEILAGG